MKCSVFSCSESDILHHDKQYEPFYSSFVALSAHYITTVCGQSTYLSLSLLCHINIFEQVFWFLQPTDCLNLFLLVPRNQLLSVAAACKVLIEFSLLRLENPDEACAVSQVLRHVPVFLYIKCVVATSQVQCCSC